VRQKEIKAFREQRATELRILKEILQENHLINDTSPLQQAIHMCYREWPSPIWNYEFTSLQFEPSLDDLRHTRPREVAYLSVELSVVLQGECCEDKTLTDPFTRLSVNVIAEGLDIQANSFAAAWHLDRHEIEQTSQTPSLLVHPCYHVHYGGEAIWSLEPDFNYGSHLLLETPRWAHFPLDGVLAIDYVLSHYMPSTWHKLREEDSRYMDVVSEAQKRCWYAYIVATAAFWLDEVKSPWQAHLLFPQLPKPKK
jgi:hypothetical protein